MRSGSRVVDETGAPVSGTRVEMRTGNGAAAVASSDLAGNFTLNPGAAGEYEVRAERQGFYLYQGKAQPFAEGQNQLTIALNHVQEFSERIDVKASPPTIDPQQPSEREEARASSEF